MDAMKLLGSLMGQGGMSSGLGGNLIGQVLGGALGGGDEGGAGGLGGLAASLGGGSEGGQGGLGGLAASLGGGSESGQGGLGGLRDLASSLGGGSGAARGAAGGVLGGLAMMALKAYMQNKSGGGGGGLGGLASMLGGGDGEANPLAGVSESEVNDQATLLVRAMVNAAKADGRVDESEQQRILERVGDAGPEEVAFLRQEFSAPLDVDGFVRDVPRGMEADVYAMSLMAIELDEHSEAKYLGQLASGLGLDGSQCNEVHRQMGAPEIFK